MPRKSGFRIMDHPDMISAIYKRLKAIIKEHHLFVDEATDRDASDDTETSQRVERFEEENSFETS